MVAELVLWLNNDGWMTMRFGVRHTRTNAKLAREKKVSAAENYSDSDWEPSPRDAGRSKMTQCDIFFDDLVVNVPKTCGVM